MGWFMRARYALRDARRRRRFDEASKEGARTAKAGPHSVVLVFDHPKPGRNPGAAVRSADVFGARAVYVIGTDHFDPTPAMGTLNNVPVRWFETFASTYAELDREGYTMLALEPAPDFDAPQFLHQVSLPVKTAFVVGNERHGLSFDPAAFPDVMRISIAHFGATSSLNVATAASIAMYEYVRQHGRRD